MPTIRPALLGALIALLLLAVYLPALGGPFLWDDRPLIVDVVSTQLQLPVGQHFLQPFWQANQGVTTSYYRPLVVLSYVLDYRTHGLNPAGFHLTNLLLHACNGILLYTILLRRKVTAPLAAFATVGWGLLPRLSEAVAWIAGRTDVLATTFVLLAFVLYRADRTSRRLLAIASVTLALLAKEVALAGVVALFVVEYHACRTSSVRNRIRRLTPLTLVTLGYLGLRLAVTRAPSTEPALGTLGRLLLILEAIGRYLWMLLDAFHPTTALGYVGVPQLPFVILGAGGVLAGLALLWWRRHKWSTDAIPLWTLGLASLLPVLHVVPLPVEFVAADRLLYLPAAAATLILAELLARLVRLSRLTWLGLLGVALALLVTLEKRIADYTDEGRFWAVASSHTSPPNTQPINELGGVFFRAGLYDEACSLYRKAAHTPNRQTLLYRSNLSLCLSMLGQHAEALLLAQEVARAQPRVRKAWLDYGLIALHALNLSVARTALERARPLSQAEEAIALLDELTTPPTALALRAAWFARIGRRPDALKSYLALLNAPDSSQAAVQSGAEYIVKFGSPEMLEPAVRQYERRLGTAAEPSLRTFAEERLRESSHLRQLWSLP